MKKRATIAEIKNFKSKCQSMQGRGLESFSILDWQLIRPNAQGIITYQINGSTPDMSQKDVDQIFFKIFDAWTVAFSEADINIKYQQVSSNAQINIYFAQNGDAHLPYQFEQNVLAYALPDRRIYMNDFWFWTVASNQGQDIFDTGVHEVGHLKGLGHTDAIGDIMQAYAADNLTITQDSIDGLLKRYFEYVVTPTADYKAAYQALLTFKDFSRLNKSIIISIAQGATIDSKEALRVWILAGWRQSKRLTKAILAAILVLLGEEYDEKESKENIYIKIGFALGLTAENFKNK